MDHPFNIVTDLCFFFTVVVRLVRLFVTGLARGPHGNSYTFRVRVDGKNGGGYALVILVDGKNGGRYALVILVDSKMEVTMTWLFWLLSRMELYISFIAAYCAHGEHE